MFWNYRVIQTTYPSGEVDFGVYEVYYDNEGRITAYTEDPVPAVCETIEELRQDLQRMLECLDNPVLVASEIVLVPFEVESDVEGS